MSLHNEGKLQWISIILFYALVVHFDFAVGHLFTLSSHLYHCLSFVLLLSFIFNCEIVFWLLIWPKYFDSLFFFNFLYKFSFNSQPFKNLIIVSMKYNLFFGTTMATVIISTASVIILLFLHCGCTAWLFSSDFEKSDFSKITNSFLFTVQGYAL